MRNSIEDRLIVANQNYSKWNESDHPRDDAGRLTGSDQSSPEGSKDSGSNINSKIRQLKKGQTILISEHGGVKVFAERSGDGKKIKLYRQTKDGFEVFHESGN